MVALKYLSRTSRWSVPLILVLAGMIFSSAAYAQFSSFQKISSTKGNFNGGLEDGDDFGESVTWRCGC